MFTDRDRVRRARHRAPWWRRTPRLRAAAVVAALLAATAASLTWLRDRDAPSITATTSDAAARAPVPAPAAAVTATATVTVGSAPADAPAAGRTVVPSAGTGRFVIAEAPAAAVGPRAHRFTVEIERGLPFDLVEAATAIRATLADPRGWPGARGERFVQVRTTPALRVLIATPETTEELCAPLLTRGRVSCRNGDRVVINARRWAFGIPDYAGDLVAYRHYVINHEVGHWLGEGHVECTAPGRPAPVMQQQSYGLDGCLRNSWPTVN